MRLIVIADAEGDLEDITRYTARTWGMEQARVYLGALLDHLDRLVLDRTLWRPVAEIRRRYWRSRQGSHLIYFFEREGALVIARVLHERMDPGRHLR